MSHRFKSRKERDTESTISQLIEARRYIAKLRYALCRARNVLEQTEEMGCRCDIYQMADGGAVCLWCLINADIDGKPHTTYQYAADRAEEVKAPWQQPTSTKTSKS